MEKEENNKIENNGRVHRKEKIKIKPDFYANLKLSTEGDKEEEEHT